ncbi:hypothetical protein DH2020_030674 [Rehmannia glutinosa]|uniref:Retrotransposon Copia-like N-terminal domain-containing protein n=1 Tax=Rehmannia glutinosa TaxID=99300 RepID=A0ABR0VN11_REHGL
MSETVIQPQSQLLTIKLGDNNYLIWKQQVWAAVNGYGLEGFLTGESTKPEKYTESTSGNKTRVINPAYVLWNRQDQLLVSWLLSSLSENVLISTVGLTTAKDIWDGLQTEFATRNTAKVMQFRLQLQTMKKGNTPMKDYLNKIKSCCDILNSAGEEIPERVQILYILGGLGPEYDSVMVSITARAEPCSLREVHAILLSFENRLESYENHVLTSTLKVARNISAAALNEPDSTLNPTKRRNQLPEALREEHVVGPGWTLEGSSEGDEI